MHSLFHIQTDHIQALDDGQARELLARLCRYQVEREGLDPTAVFWGGNQRAADAGVDVRVDCRHARDVSGPLARSVAVIQVKAEPFGPAKIEPEMAPKGVLRPSIALLAVDRGAYLIASTRDDPADPKRRDRVAAMEKVLDDHGLAGRVHVDFIGARQIADWVEQFPPLATWVRESIGKPIHGWNGYGPWAYKEVDQEAEFILGKEPRVFAPGATDGMTDIQAIDAIRRDLAAGATVRMVGLSGVGKTRMVQALFDPRIETDARVLPQDWAIYTDISNSPTPSPEAMIEALSDTTAQSVLIIDNCGQKTHSALVERKAKVACRLGLLTIEYDIQDDLPDDTTFYRLEGASEETISILLRSRYPQLSWSDVHTVIAASHGNSRLAFALASTSKHTDDLSSLKDTELFRRLFEQTQGAGDELLNCAKAASLLYSFDGEDLSPTSEMAILSTFAPTTPSNFRRNMVDLRRRGLLQERGRWRALLPHAVSNRLAALALEEHLAPQFQDRLFTQAPERVRSSFVHRLSFLHASPEAKALVSKWLEPGGYFSDLAGISAKDFPLFLRLAVVVPEQALAAAERFAKEANAGGRQEFEVDKIAQLVQSIAYDPALFDTCIQVLLDLQPLQSKDRKTNEQTLEQLKPLFQPYYSGTLAPGPQRAKFVKRLLASNDAREQAIGLELLEQSLKVREFRNLTNFQFGARKRTSGWWPESVEQDREWYLLFIGIAEPYATGKEDVGARVRTMLGRGVFGFVEDPVLAEHMAALAPCLVACDGWLSAWTAINELLRRKDVEGEFRARVSDFEKLVSPKGLRGQVMAAISMRDPMDLEPSEAGLQDIYERAFRKAEHLGQQLAEDRPVLRGLLPALLTPNTHGNSRAIGRGVGTSTHMAVLVEEVRQVVEAAADPKQLDPTFLGGMMETWGEHDPSATASFLDHAVGDSVLGPWFPYLQLSAPPDTQGPARMREALRIGLSPLWRYGQLWQLRPLAVDDATSLLSELAGKGMEGVHSAIDALYMIIYSAKERSEPEQKALGRYCQDFFTRFDWPNLDHSGERLDHKIEPAISFSAKHSEAFEDVRGVLHQAVQARAIHPRYFPSPTGNFLAPIIRRHPHEALTFLFELDDPVRRHAMSDLVLEEYTVDASGKACAAISNDLLVQWCAEDPAERILFAARICDLKDVVDEKPSAALRLYELAPDKGEFMETISERGKRAGSSEREIPIMDLTIRVLNSLPVNEETPEWAKRKQAVERIKDRIEWWGNMFSRTSRERDETFE